MNIKIINAGNCILCGREIKIVTNKKSDKFPKIFFCPRCEHRVNKEKRKAESEVRNDTI